MSRVDDQITEHVEGVSVEKQELRAKDRTWSLMAENMRQKLCRMMGASKMPESLQEI
jgi:hypothetical protein